MKKMEPSGTIPLTELPAENKVLNGHTGGAFQSTSTLLSLTKRATVNFASACGSASSIHIPKGSFNSIQFSLAQQYVKSTNSSCLQPVFNNRAFSPFCFLHPHFLMANAQHDPVVAQLERQKLTASPSHLAAFYFHSTTFLPSSSSRA